MLNGRSSSPKTIVWNRSRIGKSTGQKVDKYLPAAEDGWGGKLI